MARCHSLIDREARLEMTWHQDGWQTWLNLSFSHVPAHVPAYLQSGKRNIMMGALLCRQWTDNSGDSLPTKGEDKAHSDMSY